MVIGVDNRGGVILWILNVMNGLTTEGCTSCQTATGWTALLTLDQLKEQIRIPRHMMV